MISSRRLPLAALLLFFAGCTHEKPNFVYMPDMAYSPAVKAQAEGSMRVPPAGTVPREASPQKVPADPEQSGRLSNPLKRTKANLLRGQDQYQAYCLVCHGATGLGNGPVVPKFPPPPSLVSEKIRSYPDGRIFHIITKGQNLMPSYASQILDEDRWAIVHYVRALYRSQNPTAEDLKRAETW